MGVVCPCPPVRNDMLIPRHLLNSGVTVRMTIFSLCYHLQFLRETPSSVPRSSNTKQAVFAVTASGALRIERGLQAVDETT